MALGGVLRAALKAGDWARAAAQSRRQARALRQFSPEFGERTSTFGRTYPERAYDYLRRQGVDVSQYENALGRAPYDSPTAGGGTARAYFDWDGDGGREIFPPEMYSPIVSPYEGGRAWPLWKDDFTGERYPAAMREPEWIGRGPAPTPEFYNPYDDGFAGGAAMWPEPGRATFDVPRAFHVRPWDVRNMQPPPPFRVNGGAIQYESPGVYIDPTTGYRYDQYGFMFDR